MRWEIAQGGNGHYYEFVMASRSWPLARVEAALQTPPAGYGPGHLASFSSAAEEAFLASTFGRMGWIGFTDELVDGEWRWIDATPGIWQDPSDFASPIQDAYVDWAPGEPNGAHHENYAIFAWSGIRWNDGSGDPEVDFPYYVEYEPASTVLCSNNVDDDGDGFVDYPNDPGCSSAPDESERDPSIACDDGADNDGDGAVDFPADPGCATPSDLGEGADCNDGFDNDGDGSVDFPADPECASPSDASESAGTECSDGIDNDGDGSVDHPEDPECASLLDASESSLMLWDAANGGNGHYYELVNTPLGWPAARVAAEQRTPPAGYGTGHLASISSAAEDGFLWRTFRLDAPVFGVCIGFTDEVVEGEWRWIDETPGIWQDPDNFPNPIQTVPYQNWAGGGARGAEPNNAGNEDYAGFGFVSDQWGDGASCDAYYVEYEPAGPFCSNRFDDDGDGFTDFPDDPGCSSAMDDSERDPSLACDDGEDDDGDGAIDFPADPGCAGPSDPSEMPECSDGFDDDGDGLVDLDDPGCPDPIATPENPPCDDGLDNDGDGFVDWDDSSCELHWPYWERAPCGLGVELVAPIALAYRAHARRRRRRD